MSHQRAIAHLSQADPVLGGLIERVGPCTLRPDGERPFGALCESILYQQLSGKAAATIAGRFKALFGGAFPEPEALLAAEEAALRAVGISRSKLLALKDLARRAHDGSLDLEGLPALSDEAVIARLTQVRGIGRWTAEMFLIFALGRPDVFPAGDYGIQKAIQQLYGYQKLPAARTLHRHARRWKPYRTVATWYLWHQVDNALPHEGSKSAGGSG